MSPSRANSRPRPGRPTATWRRPGTRPFPAARTGISLLLPVLLGLAFALGLGPGPASAPRLAAAEPPATPTSTAASTPPQAWLHPPNPPHPLLQHHRFPSASLRTDVGFQIYLPPEYATRTTQRYPVLYWLHERGGSEATPLLEPALVDSAIRDQILPPLVVVYPFAGTASFYVDAPKNGAPAETLIVRELIPHIDRTVRTFPDRDGRMVQGAGMGGFGAVRLALRHPDLFGSVVAYAGEFPSIDEFGRRPDLAEVFAGAFGGDLLRVITQHPASLAKAYADPVRGRTAFRLVAATNTPASAGERELREAFRVARLPLDQVACSVTDPAPAALVAAEALAGLEFAASRLALARGLDRDGPWVTPPTNRVPRVRHHLFQSRLLDRPVGYHLHLPAGFEDRGSNSPPLPVLYHLPAWGEDQSRNLELVAYLEAATRLGAVPPAAWVWVYAGRTSWYTDGPDGSVPAERFLVDELIPHLERRWRLGGAAPLRILEGWGMGAYGALRLLAAHPDRFGAALLHNPALPDAAAFQTRHFDVWVTLFGSDPIRFGATEPLSLLTRNAAAFRGPARIRIVVGERSGRRDEARRLRDHLVALGLPHHYQEVPGEGGLRPGLWHATGLADLQFAAGIFGSDPAASSPASRPAGSQTTNPVP